MVKRVEKLILQCMRMATHLSSEKPCTILYCSMILTYTHRDAKASSRAFLYASKSSMKLVALMYVQLMQLFYLMLGLKDAWKWQAVQFWVNLLRKYVPNNQYWKGNCCPKFGGTPFLYFVQARRWEWHSQLLTHTQNYVNTLPRASWEGRAHTMNKYLIISE